MFANRVRLVAIGAAGFALLCGFALVCCTRSPTPGVTVTTTRAADSGDPTEPERSESSLPHDDLEQPGTTPPGDDAPAEPSPSIDMDEPEEPEPKLPPYLEIVERTDPARRPRVEATITVPRKLELNTYNVKLLRLTREGLPLTRTRSIVLQIDGQGIEWTPKYVAVELERSPAGEWTVVRRRPFKP